MSRCPGWPPAASARTERIRNHGACFPRSETSVAVQATRRGHACGRSKSSRPRPASRPKPPRRSCARSPAGRRFRPGRGRARPVPVRERTRRQSPARPSGPRRWLPHRRSEGNSQIRVEIHANDKLPGNTGVLLPNPHPASSSINGSRQNGSPSTISEESELPCGTFGTHVGLRPMLESTKKPVKVHGKSGKIPPRNRRKIRDLFAVRVDSGGGPNRTLSIFRLFKV